MNTFSVRWNIKKETTLEIHSCNSTFKKWKSHLATELRLVGVGLEFIHLYIITYWFLVESPMDVSGLVFSCKRNNSIPDKRKAYFHIAYHKIQIGKYRFEKWVSYKWDECIKQKYYARNPTQKLSLYMLQLTSLW